VAAGNGFGRRDYYLSREDKVAIRRCLYGVYLVGLWASTFARISIACLLLRLNPSPKWRATLWVTMSLQIANLIGTEAVELLQCRPIRAKWEAVPNSKCFNSEQMWALGYSFTGRYGEETTKHSR
jgi:hypothetical protein